MSRRIFSLIFAELRNHAPFTVLGALTGIVILLVIILINIPAIMSKETFLVLHPLHVALSAVVTSAMFRRYRKNIVLGIFVGLVGSIVLGTLSDIVMPYLGAALMGLETHGLHIEVIEDPLPVIAAALVGIAIGTSWPHTKVPHSLHVLVSTYASLFYLIAYSNIERWLVALPFLFVILFFAVWVPCCLSDIAFPLCFIKEAPPHSH